MKLSDFHDNLQTFSKTKNVDEITDLCRFYCHELGFDTFIYALRIPTQFSESRIVVIKGYPDAWLDRYWEKQYASSDPVVAHCSQQIMPIIWNNLKLAKYSASAQVMHEAGDFGMKDGISMPIHSPHGELGILSFAVNRKGKPAKEITLHAYPYVQLMAGYVHEAVQHVFQLPNPTNRAPLTLRESECLRWAADGKTTWEMARLLSLSEATINFHLNNAMIKLDVSNRQHAIAKAILQGLINPHPF
ncbi:LuxR family transcriptional regulator [Ampullimonas aquatilis]|uniref:LuxR family transcriptional regulator n=1 Tax=Ampullimonas aquatilis TaxID=1341549 RepID=UPI003C714578